MRIPCCPMPHHRASKLVFRLSIAHYLLSVTKITSLTFSLSRLFAVACIRVYAHGERSSRWNSRFHVCACICTYVRFLTRISSGSGIIPKCFDRLRLRNSRDNNKIANWSGAYNSDSLPGGIYNRARWSYPTVRNLLARRGDWTQS